MSSHFGPAEIAELAEIERVTVHDVKAVEYFLKKRLSRSLPPDADRAWPS
jgi:adenylosuccinate lyase